MKEQDLFRIITAYVPEVSKIRYVSKVNLYKEWSIWSKCFGKVIVINGVSSSGKTTLTSYLELFGFNKIAIDDIYEQHYVNYLKNVVSDLISKVELFLTPNDLWKVLVQFEIDDKSSYSESQRKHITDLQEYLSQHTEDIQMKCPSLMEVYDIMYNQAKKFIFSGRNVVLDLIMTSDSEVDSLSYCFNEYPMSVGFMYLTLEENLTRCILRNYNSQKNDLVDYRSPSTILNFYSLMYKFVPKEDIHFHKIPSSKVDKCSVIKYLELAQQHTKNFLRKVYGQAVYESEIEIFHQSVEQIYNLMQLKSDANIFAVPSVKYDFIINSKGINYNNLLMNNTIEILGEEENYVSDDYL